MTVTEVIEQATAAGLVLTINGDRLSVKGEAGPDFDRMVALIKPIKTEVIATLRIPQLRTPALWDTEVMVSDVHTSDLTDFVGAIVSASDLAVLQERCNEAGRTLHALPSDDDWYVTGVETQRRLGKLIAGGAPDEGNYHYTIKPGSPLHYPHARHAKEYKAWLWLMMKDEDGSAEVLAELYTIINGAWVGADVYVDGPNADMVVAAAGYLLNQYSVDGLPILTKGKG